MGPVTIEPTEAPQYKAFLPKLDALEKALLAADPKMPTHLREIHAYLIQFEEISHLLTEEQLAVILAANQKKLGVSLAEETKGNKGGSSRNALKNVTADDL